MLACLYAHIQGAVSELYLATDLPALEDSNRLETIFQTYSHKALL